MCNMWKIVLTDADMCIMGIVGGLACLVALWVVHINLKRYVARLFEVKEEEF